MPDAAEYWNREAPSFDDAPDHGLRDADVRAAWAALLSPMIPAAPARVADMGCGTGSLALLLASAGHIVHAVDIAPAMVERARAKAASAGLSIDVVVGDASRPPWPEQSFDLVLCRHVLWALEDPAEALRAWFRILKPGGRLLLIEGRWWTGAGLPSEEILELLEAGGHPGSVTRLSDSRLWGRPTSDERYLIASARLL